MKIIISFVLALLLVGCGGGGNERTEPPPPQAGVVTVGYVLGDSTVAAYLGYDSVSSMLGAKNQVVDISHPGDTIAQQKAKWLALQGVNDKSWVIIEVGLNDLNPVTPTAATISALQDLVNTVRYSIGPNQRLLIAQMTPSHQRQLDVLGTEVGPQAYQKWVDINEAIAGHGSQPIIAVDGRITAHVALLGDADNNLKAEYDYGDHVHENNAGRKIVADAWARALSALAVPF